MEDMKFLNVELPVPLLDDLRGNSVLNGGLDGVEHNMHW